MTNECDHVTQVVNVWRHNKLSVYHLWIRDLPVSVVNFLLITFDMRAPEITLIRILNSGFLGEGTGDGGRGGFIIPIGHLHDDAIFTTKY